jgi:hypothetical protein
MKPITPISVHPRLRILLEHALHILMIGFLSIGIVLPFCFLEEESTETLNLKNLVP